MTTTRKNYGKKHSRMHRRRIGGTSTELNGQPAQSQNTGFNTVKNGLEDAKNKVGNFFSGLMGNNGSVQPTVPPTVGGRRRKHRGGSHGVTGFGGNWNIHGAAKGGSRRRKHRGGSHDVVGFGGEWTAHANVGGSRRKRRMH